MPDKPASRTALPRLVIAATGRMYNMGIIARNVFKALLPELDVMCVKPTEVDDIPRWVVPDHDLAVLLTWSGTNANAVALAQKLSALNTLMLAITAKSFADVALIARSTFMDAAGTAIEQGVQRSLLIPSGGTVVFEDESYGREAVRFNVALRPASTRRER